LVWSLALAVKAESGGRLFNRLRVAVVVLVLVTSLTGGAQLATGRGPQDGLHVLYGGVAILLVPLARSFLNGAGRRDALLMVAAFLILGGVLFRLFATG